MQAKLARWLSVLAIAGLGVMPQAWGDLHPTCESGPCSLESEFVVFNDASPEFRITATFAHCSYCGEPGVDGEFDIDAVLHVQFGPYDPLGGCADVPYADTMTVDISTTLRPRDDGGGTVLHYYPYNPAEEFEA